MDWLTWGRGRWGSNLFPRRMWGAHLGVPVTFLLSLSLLIYSWSVYSSEIGRNWFMDMTLFRGTPRHSRTSSVWLQTPIFNIHSNLWQNCRLPISLPSSSQTQSLWKQVGFFTVPWEPTIVCGTVSVPFQHPAPLLSPDSKVLGACLKFSKQPSGEWATSFPFLKKKQEFN